MKITRIVLIIILFNLTACNQIKIAPSPSIPSLIQIGITPSLAPILQDNLEACVIQTAGIAMVLDVIPKKDLNLNISDMIIKIGESTDDINRFAVQIGWEEIILIASPDVNLENPDKNTIKEAFTSPQQKYNIFTYAENHELRIIFDQTFEIEKTTPYGHVVPNPTTMQASIEKTQNALGYIPRSWYSGKLPTIALNPIDEDNYIFPILVLTNQTPQEPISSLLGCLQQGVQNQKTLKD